MGPGSQAEAKRIIRAVEKGAKRSVSLTVYQLGARGFEGPRQPSPWLRPSRSGVTIPRSLIFRRKVVGWIPSSSAAALRLPE